jgi:putative transposase
MPSCTLSLAASSGGLAAGRAARVSEMATCLQLLSELEVVERTFAWLNHPRRLSKHYEGQESFSEAMIYIVMIRLMLRRLARD